MGKPTGFLEYQRQGRPAQPPEERIKHWNEFHPMLPEEERVKQGGRCMECGVPFCQSGVQLAGMFTGCPLHNLIPEWNDLVYSGNPGLAWERLRKTNSFPEFTGRVCPALCEAAYTCGLHGDPVTVRDDGRRFMAEVPGSEEELPCQLLLIAAGFLGPEDYAADAFEVGRDGRSNVATAPVGYFTGTDKVFAAGDMRRGQSLVVWAIAEGRTAAREVDGYLMGYSGLI